MVVERYKSNNLHVVKNDNYGVLYDVPTNSVFRITTELADYIINYQNEVVEADQTILTLFDESFGHRQETNPSHSLWLETGILKKMTFIVTTECNLRCLYCYANAGEFSGYKHMVMTTEDAQKSIDYFLEKGVTTIENVMFFGGEPLLASDTIDAICSYYNKLFRDGRIKQLPEYTMVSNLTYSNDRIAEMLTKNDIHVTVSVDGNRLIHDSQRCFPDGKGSFDIIQGNIEKLKKQITGIEATYTMNHIKNRITLMELKKKLAQKYSIDITSVSVVPVVGCKSLEVNPSLYSEFLKDEIVNVEDSYILSAYKPNIQSDLFCNAGFSTCCIMPDGDIYPCHMYAMSRDYSLGNIKDNLSIDYKYMINRLPIPKKGERPECKQCWNRKVCHICTANVLISSKDADSLITEEKCSKRKMHADMLLLKSVS